MANKESHKGYVVDIACLRSMPVSEMYERPKNHSTACALMGHCIESGYGLLDEENNLVLLDPEATYTIVDILKNTGIEKGVKLQVEREEQEGKMVTSKVSVV